MIHIPISLGELVDRVTILTIKHQMIKDDIKLRTIDAELDHLTYLLDTYEINVSTFLFQKLYHINLSLWNIEDKIRSKEKLLEFDAEFIELARSVYMNNDLRYITKKEISDLDMTTRCSEQKSYA